MSTKESSYKETFKNTTIFGGVQVINVLVSVIRGKFVSVLLGPVGMGVFSLLSAPLNLIKTITGMGLGLSAVREISEAYQEDDIHKIARVVTIIRKLFFLTGLLGASATLILAPLLSQWSFGNEEYTWSFVWLSITVFLASISNGQSTLLRGMRKISYLVKSGLIGSILGLITSVPLYYYYGIKGIVPAMIISAISTLVLTWYFTRKIPIENQKLSYSDIYHEGTDMVKMGLMLVIAIFIGSLTKYGINISISYFGNIADVGLYAAAISISSQYIGFILVSLSADYFPRLAAVNKDIEKTNKVVNQQIEIVVLLAAPLLILMIITAPLLIRVLLTSEFLVITDFIRFIAIGSFFQVTSYSIGYISFAKNDKYYYLLLEGGLSNFLNFTFSVISYYFWGLTGLGVSFLAIFGCYFIIISLFTYKRYQFKLEKNTIKLIVSMLLFLVLSLIISVVLKELYVYIFGMVILLFSSYFSYIELDKRINIKPIIIRMYHKIIRKSK